MSTPVVESPIMAWALTHSCDKPMNVAGIAAPGVVAMLTFAKLEFAAVAVPLRLITGLAFEEELLLMVSWPADAPTVAGSNTIFRVVSSPGLNAAGNAAPGRVNPAPVIVAPLIVTGTVPVEVKVTDCVAGVLTTTSPNATLVALMLRARIAAFSCRVKVLSALPALAVIVTA